MYLLCTNMHIYASIPFLKMGSVQKLEIDLKDGHGLNPFITRDWFSKMAGIDGRWECSVRLWIIKVFSCCDLSQLIGNERKHLEMHLNVLLGDSDDNKDDFEGYEPDDARTPCVFVLDKPKWFICFLRVGPT